MTTTDHSDRTGGKTPPQGVPRLITNEPDTGRLGRALHGELVAANPGGMDEGDDVLERLASALAPKLNGHNGGGPKHKFLGLDAATWTKTLLAWSVAAVLAVAAWYLGVRDALHERPTAPQVERSVKGAFESHNDSSAAHPPIQRRLETLGTEQKKIRESQVRQEALDETQTKALERIERAVNKRNRRDR
jgi:hypothetical protein